MTRTCGARADARVLLMFSGAREGTSGRPGDPSRLRLDVGKVVARRGGVRAVGRLLAGDLLAFVVRPVVR